MNLVDLVVRILVLGVPLMVLAARAAFAWLLSSIHRNQRAATHRASDAHRIEQRIKTGGHR